MKVVTFKNPKPMLLTLLRLLGGQVADHPTTAEQMRENVQRELRLRQLLRDEKQDAGRGLVAPQNAGRISQPRKKQTPQRTRSVPGKAVRGNTSKALCEHCGEPFPQARKDQRFCSPNCRKRHHEQAKREVVR